MKQFFRATFRATFRAGKTLLAPQSRVTTSARETSTRGDAVREERAWVLEFDIPVWGFRKGEQVRIFPNAPIYLDDIVALKSEKGLKLARYRDEYMGSVAGLAVRV